MIEQSRQSRQQQQPFKRNIVTACVSGTPGTQTPARWPDQGQGTSGRPISHKSDSGKGTVGTNGTNGTNGVNGSKNAKGKIIFQNTEMAEEMKQMMASSNRDQADEDYEDSSGSTSDMCISLCESFSFLTSSNDKKNHSPYGMI